MRIVKLPIIVMSKLQVVSFQLDSNELDTIKNHTSNLLESKDKISYNKTLAGHLEKEFKTTPELHNFCSDLLQPGIEIFAKKYLSEEFDTANNIYLGKSWINFQKKYEYNPVHKHTGLLSFVIWVKIPYKIEDEFKLENCRSITGEQFNGTFSFLTQDSQKNFTHVVIPADKKYEGMGVIFPAKLHHVVYPFYTSDEYRISISGNYRVK